MINILMIEDDAELASILTNYLKQYNIKITNYETPELGISALNIKKYDLIILDLSLPNIDGIEVCKMIRQKHQIPIIISSARSYLGDKIACFSYGADDSILKYHNIIPSMSRQGNCYDNAVAESFFKTLKKELVRKTIFTTREEAKSKIFEYIEMFYNSKRRHSYLGFISPNEFEKRYNESVNKS